MPTVSQLIGVSPAIRKLDEEITAAARSDAKVLVTGESGVGKEVTAQLIHARSRRAVRPQVSINCAGLTDGLLESELFGHVRGSFTGAHRDKPGLVEMARGGTLFLDEVGEMSLRMQAMLLRFLETGEVHRVGGDHVHTIVDVRLVCATNRNLSERIADGEFREDLYYRLNVIHLEIPPLRERPEDVPVLVDHLAAVLAAQHALPRPVLSQGVLDALERYAWPGNVRELKNVVERLVVRSGSGTPGVGDLPTTVRQTVRPVATGGPPAHAAAEPDDIANALFLRILAGESFWSTVARPFLAHDLTRHTLRAVVSKALEETRGRYRDVTTLFNLPERDYKKLLNFLRKHECLVPFHPFRTAKPQPEAASEAEAARPRVA